MVKKWYSEGDVLQQKRNSDQSFSSSWLLMRQWFICKQRKRYWNREIKGSRLKEVHEKGNYSDLQPSIQISVDVSTTGYIDFSK